MSGNIFQEVLNDAKGVEEKLLGPSYPYYKNIKSPQEIGMSSKGSISALAKDIDGLISYVEVLVTGKSKASVPSGPMGNKFFLQTAAKCVDASNNQEVDRYIYIDNVPEGNIPFISQGLGVNFSEFKGLIPGVMGNLNVLNPFGLLQSFTSGSKPACQQITMETINIDNVSSSETHYVTLTDIKNMDPCSFSNKKNPLTNISCRESFNSLNSDNNEVKLPKDFVSQVYFFSLASISIFILYKLMMKK
jgi:hypothetical protein